MTTTKEPPEPSLPKDSGASEWNENHTAGNAANAAAAGAVASTSENEPPVEKGDERRKNAPNQECKSNTSSSVTNKVEGSTVGVNATITGDGNQFIIYKKSRKSKKTNSKSLFGITEPLDIRKSPDPLHRLDEHYAYLDKLSDSGLVLISCADEDIAWMAGCALINGLGFPDENRRVLDLDDEAGEEEEDDAIVGLSVGSLLRKTNDAEKRTGVCISAFRDRTRNFLDSMFSTPLGQENIQATLAEKDVFLVCVTEPALVGSRMDQRTRGFQFPHWKIPFLRPLLRLRFDEWEKIEEKIESQRARGHWDKDDSVFARQARTLLNDGQLIHQVELIDEREQSSSAEPEPQLFTGDDPVPDTVLFAAAYFPDLSLINFKRVVEALLRHQTTLVSSPVLKRSNDNVLESGEIHKETPLLEIWQRDADKILTRCRLEIVSGADSSKVVDFADQGMREKIRSCLEREFSFYLEKQVEKIRQEGLIFHRSGAISENAIRFIVARAAVCPDDFDKAWLVEIVSGLERNSSLAVQRAAGGTDRSSLAAEPLGHTKARTYSRIAEVLRAMLDRPELSRNVNEVLEQMMIARLHWSVLQITKRLRFAPDFDDLKWVKRLFARGDQQARNETMRYMLFYLESLGSDVYEKLAVLKTWLPEEDDDSLSAGLRVSIEALPQGQWSEKDDPPRQVSLSALDLVMRYCVDTTLSFDSEDYGAWPSRFPLFAFENRSASERDGALLVQWLFHPAMKHVESSSLIGLVIAVWAFILKGPPDKPAEKRRVNGSSKRRKKIQEDDLGSKESTFDSAVVLELLLKHIAAAATADQRRMLVRDWQQMIQFMFGWIDELKPGEPLRKELVWQRNRTRELIRQFKETSKAVGSARTKLPARSKERLV